MGCPQREDSPFLLPAMKVYAEYSGRKSQAFAKSHKDTRVNFATRIHQESRQKQEITNHYKDGA